MDLLVLQGDVDEFREIMGIINRDMDLVTLSDENLRRVFMIFEIAFGVVNARTKTFYVKFCRLQRRIWTSYGVLVLTAWWLWPSRYLIMHLR